MIQNKTPGRMMQHFLFQVLILRSFALSRDNFDHGKWRIFCCVGYLLFSLQNCYVLRISDTAFFLLQLKTNLVYDNFLKEKGPVTQEKSIKHFW